VRRYLRKHVKRRMIRPIVYMTCSRFLCAVTLALLWNRYLNAAGLVSIGYAYTIIGLLFLALAWFSYLRLDGIKMPFARWLPLQPIKQSSGPYGDIPDYLDEGFVSFAELPEEERNICSLCANVVLSAVFLLLSLA
jgi:hypothetical protein